jgi:hypothetical protein
MIMQLVHLLNIVHGHKKFDSRGSIGCFGLCAC